MENMIKAGVVDLQEHRDVLKMLSETDALLFKLKGHFKERWREPIFMYMIWILEIFYDEVHDQLLHAELD